MAFVLTPTRQPIHKKAAMGESSGVTGGYTVPPVFYNQRLANIEESTFIRHLASSSRWPVPRISFPTSNHHHPGRGRSPFFSGVQMYWTAEAQTRTDTEPADLRLLQQRQPVRGPNVVDAGRDRSVPVGECTVEIEQNRPDLVTVA
jgi:HK97 family phage major capsid protein